MVTRMERNRYVGISSCGALFLGEAMTPHRGQRVAPSGSGVPHLLQNIGVSFRFGVSCQSVALRSSIHSERKQRSTIQPMPQKAPVNR